MTTHPKPARVDLGDGDSLILFRTDDWHTTVRFHSANPNTSLAGAVMATDALRDALDKIAPTDDTDFAALWKETARRAIQSNAYLDSAAAMEQQMAMSESLVAAEAINRAEKAEENVRAREEMINRLAARAEKAEQERDSVQAALVCAIQENDRLRADQPRPLTADDITDEMVERGRSAYWGDEHTVEDIVRSILTAALTEPPTRPKGAEFWESVVADQVGGDLAPDAIRTLADTIAQRSARVTGAES